MKTFLFWVLFGILLALVSCQPSGVIKDLNTGLTVTYSGGLKPKECFIVKTDDGGRVSGKKIPLNGFKFSIIIAGVEGYNKLKNGKVSLGCELEITEKESNASVLSVKDALKGEYDAKLAETLNADFMTGTPMKAGKEYIFKAKFYDKNGKGKITAQVALTTE
ncbi:MAG: hypothetical protein NZ455_07190 [Bacteroidia bacterium]|nr:hypothetical protein [Bacteroidia bacterium]MDW8346537.1 hypothetical protein [Bacteroidia bacterium]